MPFSIDCAYMISAVSTDMNSPRYVPTYKDGVDMGGLYSLRIVQHRTAIRYQAKVSGMAR